jgi:hypothetical protein
MERLRSRWRKARERESEYWDTKASLAGLRPGYPEPPTPEAIRAQATLLAPTAVVQEILWWIGEYIFFPALVLASVIGGLASPSAWLDAPSGVGGWAGMLALWLPLFVLGAAIARATISDSVDEAAGPLGRFALLVAVAGIATLIVVVLDRTGAPFGLRGIWTYAASAAALSVAIALVGFVFLFAFFAAGEYALRRIAVARHPDSVLVQALLDAVSDLHMAYGSGQGARVVSDRRLSAVRSLENAAVTAERYLPRRVNPKDQATAIWLRGLGGEVASALRAHKRWIITQSVRDEAAVDRLRATLMAAAAGNWRDLERRTVYEIPRSSRLLVLLATTLRGGIPLAVVVALRAFDVRGFEGAYGDYALIVAAVWLVVSFLAQYDPLFSTKIGAVTDLSKTLRGGGR